MLVSLSSRDIKSVYGWGTLLDLFLLLVEIEVLGGRPIHGPPNLR
jgi:hypothetical protein